VRSRKNALRVLAVAGSLSRESSTRVVICEASRQLVQHGCEVDILDFQKDPLPLYNPNTAYDAPSFPSLKLRVDRADVLLLGTPDYHGGISSVMKSFLDHFWREFAGKLFATIVSSHEKGLTVTDQLRTVARQCYAWSLPYGVSFIGDEDVSQRPAHHDVPRHHRLRQIAGQPTPDRYCFDRSRFHGEVAEEKECGLK
jgi:NAD(P)H-dependent FMN reductase